MESLKIWLVNLLVHSGLVFVFFLAVIFLAITWGALDSLEDKKWNIYIKIILCLLIIIFIQMVLNVAIFIFFRFEYWVYFILKPIYERAIVPIVFFKAIPKKGKYVALFFVFALVAFEILVIILTPNEITFPILMSLSSVITYMLLIKGKLIEHDNM